MKISIITVTFNSINTLLQTIKSVEYQTYKDIEYIVVDGGSTDGTVDLIKEYASLGVISKWISENDDGIYDAFNTGISLATGEYVYFLGSDDLLINKQIIFKVNEDLEKDRPDIYSGGVYCVDEDDKMEIFYGNEFARKNDFCGEQMIPHQGMFTKRNLFKKEIFDKKYRISADYKFFLQMIFTYNASIVYTDLAIAYYSSGGVSSNDSLSRLKENDNICMELGMNDVINKRHEKIRRYGFLKKIMKKLEIDLFVKKVILKAQGKLKKHDCEYDFCRWCKR